MIDYYDSQITQILPGNMKNTPEVRAVSYAISNAVKKVVEYSKNASLYAVIDQLPGKILDLVALELRTQYYDETMQEQKKRDLIKNTIMWHYTAGTAHTVKELIRSVFRAGEVLEWYEYGGEPYYFRIRTDTVITENVMVEFKKIIKDVQNVRSHLDAIEIERNHIGEIYIGMVGKKQIKAAIREGD